MVYFLIFQLERASNRLLDYGVLGVMVIGLAVLLYRMWEKINKDQEMWRSEAIESRKAFITLSQQQNLTNQKLIAIRERDVDQNKDFHVLIQKKIDEFPSEVRKEMKAELMEHQVNITSAGKKS